MHRIPVFTIVCLFLWSGAASGGPSSYVCVIKSISDISDEGLIASSGFEQQLKGGSFTVTRASGAIAGDTLTTVLAKDTYVVNAGSTDNSFKAIATFDGQVQTIEIKEFKDGDAKPFVALSMGGAGIVTGVCI